MKLMWTGSDVLFCTRYPKHSKKSKYIYMFCLRIFARIADYFIEGHYVVSEHLRAELEPLKFKKPIKVQANPPIYTKPVKKIPHKVFNILYYRGLGSNQTFQDWVYGHDVMMLVMEIFEDDYIHLIEVNGINDMSKIYPFVDFMVRPNRHDGNPRMVMECEINEIPYYCSKSDPNPSEIIRMIKHEISLQKAQNQI